MFHSTAKYFNRCFCLCNIISKRNHLIEKRQMIVKMMNTNLGIYFMFTSEYSPNQKLRCTCVYANWLQAYLNV